MDKRPLQGLHDPQGAENEAPEACGRLEVSPVLDSKSIRRSLSPPAMGGFLLFESVSADDEHFHTLLWGQFAVYV